ncbi:CamS family sex pheromone protein [uncultured Granulicatella sp.]|uniref:CamS family sex pheromone protein n=1 Tax=uncultured Granulicatella sp. TaxID=316089 RepID=UPI002609EE18|nr:CamS family sex pheromone protein [uncultured Granulicatella sp.]
MKHKLRLGLLGLMSVFTLAACADITQANRQNTNTKNDTNTKVVQSTTNQLSNNFYRALITNGKYQVSQNRGATLSLNTGFNLKNFETGLIELSRTVFPTNQYFFREGQVIDSDTTAKWIARKSDKNPEGLNPADNRDTSPTGRAPLYLAQILEQDYMIQTENNFELGGISIGVAMNSVDYYTNGDRDAETKISKEVMIEQAKTIVNQILTRLRQNDALKAVPIVFGVFRQTSKDDIGGGVYVLEATSVEGTEITNWTNVNQKVTVLPLVNEAATEESTAFENFKTEVQNVFPNLSGVTARVKYQDNVAKKMVIDIMTQFYGESEIIALAQHVTDAANKYLSKTTPVEVRISSINGVEAFLMQDLTQGVFTYHIFD